MSDYPTLRQVKDMNDKKAYIQLEVSQALKRKVRVKAFEQGLTLKKLITNLLINYLQLNDKNNETID